MKVGDPSWWDNPPVHMISHMVTSSDQPDQFELGDYVKRTVSSPQWVT